MTIKRRSLITGAVATGAGLGAFRSGSEAQNAIDPNSISVIPAPRLVESAVGQSDVQSSTANVIPAPLRAESEATGSVTIDANGWFDPQEGTGAANVMLRSGLRLYLGLELVNRVDVPQDTLTSGTRIGLAIRSNTPDPTSTMGVHPDGGDPVNEGYTINVSDDGIQIEGETAEGTFRGATTLLQMAVYSPEIPHGTITDAPRFAWRGLSFDTVRCFHPVDTVKHVLDLLTLYKMNVFHFHLTDSEGWRFQVDEWPLLTDVSGQTARGDRPGGYYTTEEFADIVQYAADRFIRVIPEFDSPGHTASVINAYPELASAEIREMDPAMQYLHPHQDGVADLLRDVYTAMAEQTNADYIHIGGDEAIAMDQDLFHEYVQLAVSTAHETGKGVVGWQEAARGGVREGDLLQWWIPDEMVASVQAAKEAGDGWGGWAPGDPVGDAFLELFSMADQDVPLALDQGADVIISSAKWMYLDTRYPEESASPEQEDQRQRLGIPAGVYYNGTVEDSYHWNPETVNADLPLGRIAGVEAAIWCESIEDESDLFFQLLPRLCGIAEKGWSDGREWDEYRERLAVQPLFWDAMGLTWFKSSAVW